MVRKLQQSIVCLSAILAASFPVAQAQEDQFYLVGKTVNTQAGVQVYLRWDVIETALPDDVARLQLFRNGVEVGDWPADGVMSAAEIASLYQGPEHRQRKLETITRLNELSSDQGIPFSATQFATTLYQLIDPGSPNYNPLWAYLGSRTDFNIARARYRAWIDSNPETNSSGLVRYELLAVSSADPTVKVTLGEITFDPAAQMQSLGAGNFRQVRVSDWRCDLPENSQDHYTVMLDWDSPGAGNVSDRFAAQNYIAGFDLYRTAENLDSTVTAPPARDIAALVAAADIDSRGRPVIDGLEKVNVALIIDSGAPSIDPEWLEAKARLEQVLPDDQKPLPVIPEHKIPRDPKWVEARDQLVRAGLKPGDRRAYYLVPRDFTGNYGPTVAEIVQVPLMTRPPAPWRLRGFADETTAPAAFTFTWDEVNLESYIEAYRGTRLFCNTVEARSTGVLEYVPIGESCAAGNRNAVRVNATDYHVYRFTNFDLAARFKDSDGDGASDSDETPDLDRNDRIDAFERSAGLQCDPLNQPDGVENHLVYPASGSSVTLIRPSLLNPDSPAIVRMRDTVPSDPKDTVYWYRVASRAIPPGPVGRLSYLGPPQRALFPDRNMPAEPGVFVGKPGSVPEGCAVETDPSQTEWSFDETLSLGEKGSSFELSCGTSTFTVTRESIRQNGDGPDQCDTIAQACNGLDVTIDYTPNASTGDQPCNPTILAKDVNFCQSGAVALVPDLVDGLVAVEPGALVPGGATIEVTAPEPDPEDPDDRICIALYENIDGSATRVGSTCDPEPLTYFPRPGLFCGYAVATDENNNISTTVQIPCFITPLNPKAPSPPQVLTLNVDNDLARFTFRLPPENVAMAMVRLDYEPGSGEPERTIETIPVIDNVPGESIGFSMPVEPFQRTADRFCLAMLSVGRDDGTGRSRNSDWSTEKCFSRTATGEDLPKYLPWPAVQGATEGGPLIADRVTDYRSVPEFLAFIVAQSDEFTTELPLGSIEDCWLLKPGQTSPDDPPPMDESTLTVFDGYFCRTGGVTRFRSLVTPELGFIVYRQSRVGGGDASPWVQVSPYIDYVHFDREVIQSDFAQTRFTVWALNDPYFELVELDGAAPGVLTLLFVDQYPFLAAGGFGSSQVSEWRYQVVYFDGQRRPVKWRASDWFRGDD